MQSNHPGRKRLTATILMIGLLTILFFLDLAALHDILKGEPDLSAEYTMILASLFMGAGLFYYLASKRKTAANRNHTH